MTESQVQSKLVLILRGILKKLSHPRLYYFLGSCVMLITGLIWVVDQWQNTYPFLQKIVPLWFVLLIICPLLIVVLIINRKNKSLQKELERHSSKSEKETLTFTHAESPKIAPGISIQSVVKKDGRYCVSNNIICIKFYRSFRPDNHIRANEYACREAGCKVKIKTSLTSFAYFEVIDLTEAIHTKNTQC